jgi:hypothetical protein
MADETSSADVPVVEQATEQPLIEDATVFESAVPEDDTVVAVEEDVNTDADTEQAVDTTTTDTPDADAAAATGGEFSTVLSHTLSFCTR